VTGGVPWPANLLPAWAETLARSCAGYAFTTQQVREGRSVVATRTGDGPGPVMVITASEAEMRAALKIPACRESEGLPGHPGEK
jgi:hypothetical protein